MTTPATSGTTAVTTAPVVAVAVDTSSNQGVRGSRGGRGGRGVRGRRGARGRGPAFALSNREAAYAASNRGAAYAPVPRGATNVPASRGTSRVPLATASPPPSASPQAPIAQTTPTSSRDSALPRVGRSIRNLRAETTINPTPSQLNVLEKRQNIRLEDALDHEFNYYCVLARQLTGSLEEGDMRNDFITWIHLLVNPLIISSQEESVRVKRNRYLFLMVVSMLNDDHEGFLKTVSTAHKKFDFKRKAVKVAGMRGGGPSSVPDKISNEKGVPISLMTALIPTKLMNSANPIPEWERQRTWDEYLDSVKKGKKVKTSKKSCRVTEKYDQRCIFHHDNECETTPVTAKIGKALDFQFEFLIDLARSSAIPFPNTVPLTSLWMQALCEIDESFCTEMKGIRNDYACLLVGYMTNLQLDGPFEDPPTKPLCPLREAAMSYARRRPAGLDTTQIPLNPVGESVENFMNECPMIDEGAFAFLALSGSMFSE